MIVAWQFSAWNMSKKGTVPQGTVRLGRRGGSASLSGEHASRPTQTVPYGGCRTYPEGIIGLSLGF
jgi:hypothetical protein